MHVAPADRRRGQHDTYMNPRTLTTQTHRPAHSPQPCTELTSLPFPSPSWPPPGRPLSRPPPPFPTHAYPTPFGHAHTMRHSTQPPTPHTPSTRTHYHTPLPVRCACACPAPHPHTHLALAIASCTWRPSLNLMEMMAFTSSTAAEMATASGERCTKPSASPPAAGGGNPAGASGSAIVGGAAAPGPPPALRWWRWRSAAAVCATCDGGAPVDCTRRGCRPLRKAWVGGPRQQHRRVRRSEAAGKLAGSRLGGGIRGVRCVFSMALSSCSHAHAASMAHNTRRMRPPALSHSQHIEGWWFGWQVVAGQTTISATTQQQRPNRARLAWDVQHARTTHRHIAALPH